jgi:SulP family sulfate permease
LLALGLVVFMPKAWARVVPAPLAALLVCSLAALWLNGAPQIGATPSGLPQWQLPGFDFALLNEMLIYSAVLAALGSIDSLLTSLVADNVTRSFHDSDKELVGQGLGNLAAGLAGGIPGAGATIRTLSNVHAGGRTPISGAFHAIVLLAVAFGMGPLVAHIPYAALAGILIKVGIDVIDWRFIRRLHRAPRTDLVLMFVVLALTIFVDVVTAVGVGVVIASLVFVKEMAELQVNAIRTISDPGQERLFDDETAALYREYRDSLMFLHLSGPISFGAANELTRRFARVGEYEVLIIDFLDVPHMDGSAAIALEEVMERAREEKKHVIIVGMTFSVARMMGRLGALDGVRDSERFDTRAEAVRAAVEFVKVSPGSSRQAI